MGEIGQSLEVQNSAPEPYTEVINTFDNLRTPTQFADLISSVCSSKNPIDVVPTHQELSKIKGRNEVGGFDDIEKGVILFLQIPRLRSAIHSERINFVEALGVLARFDADILGSQNNPENKTDDRLISARNAVTLMEEGGVAKDSEGLKIMRTLSEDAISFFIPPSRQNSNSPK